MDHYLRTIALACLLACTAAAQGQSPKLDLRAIHAAALANPFDDAKFEAYLRTLPTVELKNGTRLYITEGDLLRTRDQVRVDLGAKLLRQGDDKPAPTELIVNLQNGTPDYWETSAQRTLRYSVDRSAFRTPQQYETVVRNMRAATQDWEDACSECGIRFVHAVEADEKPTLDKVTFIVTLLDSNGEFIAAAFFPSDPSFRRYMHIDPSYFSTDYDPVGVLRHELGHVLGYRHEHTRDVAGCYFEDRQWKPLTSYDPHSVMHYFCGGGGTMDLSLTDVDRAGHRKLYLGKPSPTAGSTIEAFPHELRPASDGPSTLVIRFEGGEIDQNLTQAVSLLIHEKVIGVEDYTVVPGDNLCAIYMRRMGFPARVNCPEPLIRKLAEDLNRTRRGISLKTLSPGQMITVPRTVALRTYNYGRVYDMRQADDTRQLAQDQKKWNVSSQSRDAPRKSEISFEGYEIRLAVDRPDRLRPAIADLRSANVYVNLIPSSLGGVPLHSSDAVGPNEHVSACRQSNNEVGEGAYLLMFKAQLDKVRDCVKKCTGPRCAQIIMTDTNVELNPDILSAVVEGGTAAADRLELGARPPCLETDFKTKAHHGTHLAGIMVSQQNGYGFIGLSPAAQLYTYDYRVLSDDALADLISKHMDRIDGPARKIFLFASSFRPYPPEVVNTQTFRLKTLNDRFAKLAAKRIKELMPLWITAVGQPGDDSPIASTTEIYRQSPMAPMNLGDLPNVVTVTACGDCSDEKASLMTEAHFSIADRLVHIAAPGKDIPGWVSGTQMAVAPGGTSQAAAFVAGVAASMKNCDFDYYADPGATRQRLMLTARPVLDEDDSRKVRSGIVDAKLALLDPRKTWMKLATDIEPVEVEAEAWCAPSIRLVDPVTNTPQDRSFDTPQIGRITRFRRTGDGIAKRWVIFTPKGTDDIVRSDPGTFKPTASLLKLKNGTLVPLDLIDELILARPITRTAC